MKNSRILLTLKSMIVGGTMLVPGVSGGSMAMILGIYDKLVASVSSFMKDKRKNLITLVLFAIGGGIGMLLFANPLLRLIEWSPMPTLYFFIGAVAGGIPLMVKQAEVKKFSWKQPFYVAAGILIVLLFTFIPTGTFQAGSDNGIVNFLLLMLAGFIAAVALVLPGISVSYFLLLLGLYDETMRAITTFYFPFLIPLALGLLLGIILTTKLLERAMKRHPQPTYLIILGFVLGSIAEVFPGIPTWPELLLCLVTLVAGLLAIYFLSRQELKYEEA